jgi:hypothetical protein
MEALVASNEVAWDQFNNLLDVWQTTSWPIPELYGQIVPFKDDKDLWKDLEAFWLIIILIVRRACSIMLIMLENFMQCIFSLPSESQPDLSEPGRLLFSSNQIMIIYTKTPTPASSKFLTA